MSERLKFLLVEVIDPHYHADLARENMKEVEMLVATFGGEVVEKLVQHRVKPHRAMYVGPGKVEEIKLQVRNKLIDVVVINALVRSGQLFRLEKALWQANPKILVWDRVDLILGIFEKHAVGREAKLQIELAKIEHMGPRIYGLGRTVLSRQAGGIGTRGVGETNIELERRQMKKRKQEILKELGKIATQKKRRIKNRREMGLGPVALVGYTSAGKTTLFNRLTGKRKRVDQGLFTTLDAVVGRMKQKRNEVPILVSDTIGFIENLPPKLVAAFRSTLMESMEAKLVLHVVDGEDRRIMEKKKVVEEILADMGIERAWLVVNKVDLLTGKKLADLKRVLGKERVVWVSALMNEGIDELKKLLVAELKQD